MAGDTVVQVTWQGDIAWVTINNPPVNATSSAVRAGLSGAVDAVQGARLAVLQGAGRCFVAGGDMSEFDRPPELPHLPDVVQKIEDSAVPFLALMHGSVLGGGWEIAMACAWRMAAPGTQFGLSEVHVGLIPGAGGTQRCPRLIGMETAIDMACRGRAFGAEEMLDLGGIDRILADPQAAVSEFAKSLPDRPLPVSRRTAMALTGEALQDVRMALEKRAKGQASPLENLEALQWVALPFAEGRKRERARHLELRQSPQSRALRHAFFAERQAAKPRAIAGVAARDISAVAVVGGGLMGAGIAMAALSAGVKTTIIERDSAAAAAATARVHGLLGGALKRGKISAEGLGTRKALFHAAKDYSAASDADLAIEAVFEDLDVKREVFQSLDAVMRADAILATNTSYLDPTQIFEGISNPSRCLGLHFFSPAHVMKLLEVIRTPQTSPEVLATGFAFGRRLNKMTVLSEICDGFVGNRMLAAYRREAEYLLADGALPDQVDAAMQRFGMPMGPFELQDLTGLQIGWANRKRQAATRDRNERYETIADRLCEMGRLGQRTGAGWYRYVEGGRTPQRDPEVAALITEYSATHGIARRDFSTEQIVNRLLAVLVNEGARIVEEGIAERFGDVDTVQIHGYGFPRWRGGPMFYGSERGWDKLAADIAKVAAASPGSWVIADQLKGTG
jgi:3-hydroxyacyl-CoA dehydrogenase